MNVSEERVDEALEAVFRFVGDDHERGLALLAERYPDVHQAFRQAAAEEFYRTGLEAYRLELACREAAQIGAEA